MRCLLYDCRSYFEVTLLGIQGSDVSSNVPLVLLAVRVGTLNLGSLTTQPQPDMYICILYVYSAEPVGAMDINDDWVGIWKNPVVAYSTVAFLYSPEGKSRNSQ